MKNLTKIFCQIALIGVFSTPVIAQGWEIIIADSSLINSFSFGFISGPNDGFRIVYEDIFNGSGEFKYLNYDANGDYINNAGIPGTSNWDLIQSDNSGATYWETNYKIKKINADNQTVWTYYAPATAGIFWKQSGPNGSTYAQYNNNIDGHVIDAINKDGILEHRFIFNDDWPNKYIATSDFGMLHTDDYSGTATWTKLDRQGNVVWVKEFLETESVLMGSADGATYYVDTEGKLVKLDALGNVAWVKPLFSGNISIHYVRPVELQDGNVGIAFGEYNNFNGDALQMMKISAQTGEKIWEKTFGANLGIIFTGVIGFIEIPDGGLLAGYEAYDSNFENVIIVVRADANGNTLTSQINGKIFRDGNSDCTWQNTEDPMNTLSVIAQSGSKTYSTTTDNLGNFSIPVSYGTYQLTYGQLGSYWDFCATPTISILTTYDTVTANIGTNTLVECPELAVSLGSNVFRRCFDNNYLKIDYKNIGTAPAENAYVDLFLDSQLEFLSSTPIAAVQQNNQLFRFELGTLDVGEVGQISVNIKVDCDAELEEILCATANILPDTLCLPTASKRTENQFCLPVVASFDPNDKTAFLNGRPESSSIPPNTELEYLIRFQNTGNDTAFNIVILDTLTTYLNAASVLPGAASHLYTFDLLNGHILRFSFKNILLPDSNTNEVASHGFVKFLVRQNSTAFIGNEIKNSAAIYFDFNDPVITNETKLVIAVPSGTEEAKTQIVAQIFPVPAHDMVQVVLQNTNGESVTWRLFDTTGKLVSTGQSAAATVFDIPRKNQPAGMYHCQFLLDNGQMTYGKIFFD